MKRAQSHFWNFCILFIFLSEVSFTAYSQKIESNLIKKYSSEQGLSSNIIYSIIQDKKGLIWIASEEGLNKFDGKNFSHFTVNKGRYSLSHNRTQTMILAPDGNIWAGTSDGLNIYDYKSDSIIQVRKNTKPLQLIYNDITYLTYNATKSIIWMGTYGNGVHYFDWKRQTFHALKLPTIQGVAAPQNVMSILEDDNKRLWIGTQNNGLYRYNPDEKKLEHYSMPVNGQFVRTIYQDSYRRIWIGTSKGCYIYNETTNVLDLVTYPESLINNSIGTIKEDKNGRIWIGTELFLLNFQARLFSITQKFQYNEIFQGESGSRLSCPSVNSLFVDYDNNVWIGTAWGGLNMINGTSNKFLLYKHDSENPSSLPNSPLNAICALDNSNLLVATMGTDKIGICRLNINTGAAQPLPIDQKLKGYVYQALMLDSKKNVWVGTYNKGLLKMDVNGNSFKQFTFENNDPKSLPGNDIRTIYEAKDGKIWIGTNNGLAWINNQTNEITRVTLNPKSNFAIRVVKEDNKNTLWLGTYGAGIITYNTLTGKISEKPIRLSPHIITDIFIQSNLIWLTTFGDGLMVHNTNTNKTEHFTTSIGFASNYLSSIQADNKGNLWIGSSKGISKFDPKTKEVVTFGTGDGIQSREFSERAALQLNNGLMVFAGFSGINVFNPLNVTKNDKCPPVVFTKLMVFNELVSPSNKSEDFSPITENISLAKRIVLKHSQSVFSIEFMGINYNANPKIQYAYFLEGSDKKWNLIGNQNNVTFRNLSPGRYVFKVKASSPDAVWDDKNTTSIQIEVLPPFWASVWAYIIYLILSVIIVYYVWYFAKIRIQTANGLKIERAKREKDEELHQEKLQFFTNISHEFRTPLTLIIGPLEKMQEGETDTDKKLSVSLMLRNAKRLLSMVNQLLDFRKAERGQMKLKVQFTDIMPLLHEIVQSFEDLRRQKNIKVEIISPTEDFKIWFDSEFINKSIFNLLSNAFKFTPDSGKITISLSVQNDALGNSESAILVTDNGKGIQQKDIHSIFERFYQGEEKSMVQQGSGIGLHLVRNLIELHHGTIDVESTPDVSTCFRIVLPNEESAYLPNELLSETNPPESHQDILNETQGDDLDIHFSKKQASKLIKRILLVEDNADIRIYIKSILGAEYEVSEAENGSIGLEMATLHEYDLIISDIMMPEMDGIEMCKRLKKSVETSHIPIILLTAKSGIDNRIEGLNVGADSYITKPFHPQHLMVRVSKLIELRENMKERYSRRISLGEIQQSVDKNDSPDEAFLQKSIQIILHKMMDTDFNGDALAIELNISRMGLHRKIKAFTGQSTGEFIRNIRLKKAAELLQLPGRNISEVCYDVGFNSPSYFSTCFTEVYKMTPSEYAKQGK